MMSIDRSRYEGCQLPSLPRMAEGDVDLGPQTPVQRFKAALARPWNYEVKPFLKRTYTQFERLSGVKINGKRPAQIPPALRGAAAVPAPMAPMAAVAAPQVAAPPPAAPAAPAAPAPPPR
jgi:hypothetical protein